MNKTIQEKMKMKTTNFFGSALCLAFIVLLFGSAVYAQSTDPDNPTPLVKREIQGKNMGGKDVVYYYSFTAGPGTLEITTDVKNGNQTGRLAILYYSVLDANFKELKRVNAIYADARSVQEITVNKKQKLILKLEVGLNTGGYRIQLDGAVNFAADDDVEDITGETTQVQQQICMPRNGILFLTMNDGKKVKVDLGKVQKIDIQ